MKFTEDFFKREKRDGFEISGMMKRAWAAQIEVLQVVIEVCQRNGLQYFADWGTLLGAVRHHGFIPWDDDIDICLKREDYNQLIRILPQQVPMIQLFLKDMALHEVLLTLRREVIAHD